MTGRRVRVFDARSHCYDGRLRTVAPRASNKLPDRSLSASFGGPLDVTEENTESEVEYGESSIRLIDPHFVLRVELADQAAAQLKSGMRVRIDVGHRYESLWRRAATAFRQFWHQSMIDADP